MVEAESTPIFGDRAKLDAEVERRKQNGQHEPIATKIPEAVSFDVREQNIEKICEQCANAFACKVVFIGIREGFSPKYCPLCQIIRQKEREEEQRREDRVKAESDWFDICPPLYRDTDVAKLPIAPATIEKVLHWTPGATGIGLAGSSGTGKTRLIFLLLRQLHFQGIRCRAMTAKRFENYCHRMFDKQNDARLNIAAAKTCKVLFIDDIGKEKYTERVESEFYDLIEHRTSHLLPILWTANATGEQLVRMMGEDRGAPIVRRLREFSTVISV